MIAPYYFGSEREFMEGYSSEGDKSRLHQSPARLHQPSHRQEEGPVLNS